MRLRSVAVMALVGAVAAGCGEPEPPPLSPELELGKRVWEQSCQVCHGPGLAGAPKIGDQAAWAPRIQQGLDVLIQRATSGFIGPKGDEMPARGGNPDLGDGELAAAVKYMVNQSQ